MSVWLFTVHVWRTCVCTVQVCRTWKWLYKCLWRMCEVCGWDFSQCVCDCLHCMEEEHGRMGLTICSAWTKNSDLTFYSAWTWVCMCRCEGRGCDCLWCMYEECGWDCSQCGCDYLQWIEEVRGCYLWLCHNLQCMEEERGRRTCVWLFTVCMGEESGDATVYSAWEKRCMFPCFSCWLKPR
jgi:hypothetical protein